MLMGLYRIWCRCRMRTLMWLLKFMNAPKPLLLVGPEASLRLCRYIAQCDIGQLLLVTDRTLVELGVIQPLLDELEGRGVDVTLFDSVLPDPTEEVVAAGTGSARAAACDGVLAVGGGSSIDAAKIIAVAAATESNPLAGGGPFMRPGLPLFAVPTTAGTGSEVSLGAVITDSRTHTKRGVGGPGLVPQAAALDPILTRALPPSITAATGMDALTHAIEAYIGTCRNPEADRHALVATRLIFNNLVPACRNGTSLEAREAMLMAAAYAGFAVNVNFVGNVHAIAHQLGARYGIPHGLANAVVLPHVLEYSLGHATERLAQLARHAGLGEASNNDAELARALVDQVVELNRQLDLPDTLAQIQQADILELARLAVREGAGYPSSRFLTVTDCQRILERVSHPREQTPESEACAPQPS